MDVLDGAADEGGAQDALGYLGSLLLALLGLQVEKRQVDVSLQVWTEPRLEVRFLCCVESCQSMSGSFLYFG